jgi:FKBP-type peptidyl-prolyl cis-trans isomerase FkpA
MKRISISFLLSFMLLIILSACKEDKWLDWKILNDQWYAKHKNDDGFVTTSTGVCYKIIHPGWSYDRKPTANSVIVFSYKGSLIDGSVFDKIPNDSSTSMYLSSAIPGWKEILPKVHNGTTLRLYIPSASGYGTSTDNKAIPPNSVLIFDIDLKDSY